MANGPKVPYLCSKDFREEADEIGGRSKGAKERKRSWARGKREGSILTEIF